MNRTFEVTRVLLFVLALAWLPGCGRTGGMTPVGPVGTTTPAPSEPVSGTVYIWIGAGKDAHVSCGRPAGGCPEGNTNYGLMGSLSVAGWELAIKSAYVYFDMPQLPDGTEIQEAYFEMYHGGAREDGKTDDVLIPVARVGSTWDPRTITYNNQPNKTPGARETAINLNSQDWSGTPNIVGIVNDWMANPQSNHGLVTSWSPLQAPYIEKGFYSINHPSRTLDDMGLAPRLLLKVQLPPGTDSNDIFLPAFLPVGHDLPTQPGQAITMMRTAGGAEWPADWNVRQGL